jgi:hypothetical protein
MDEFLRDGQSLLEAAGAAPSSGDHTILIGRDGMIRVFSELDRPLDSLAVEHGAKSAFRVRHAAGLARVEGRSGSRSLLLTQETPVSFLCLLAGGAC